MQTGIVYVKVWSVASLPYNCHLTKIKIQQTFLHAQRLLPDSDLGFVGGEGGGRSRKRWTQRTRIDEKSLVITASTNCDGPSENTSLEREREGGKEKRERQEHSKKLLIRPPFP